MGDVLARDRAADDAGDHRGDRAGLHSQRRAVRRVGPAGRGQGLAGGELDPVSGYGCHREQNGGGGGGGFWGGGGGGGGFWFCGGCGGGGKRLVGNFKRRSVKKGEGGAGGW